MIQKKQFKFLPTGFTEIIAKSFFLQADIDWCMKYTTVHFNRCNAIKKCYFVCCMRQKFSDQHQPVDDDSPGQHGCEMIKCCRV